MKKIIIVFLLVLTLPTKASSIVMDMDSNRILYENNKDNQRLIASITKIMTAIITIENTKDINKKIVVGEEVLTMYGTNIYIEVGEIISIKDLLYGLILRSGNDAALTLAIATSKTEANFVKLMNKKTQELNMKNTYFSNPHGLDEYTQNKSTAHDMAILSSYAYKNPIYREISKTKRYETNTKNKSYIWYNRNKLLSLYEYATGGKNGYTPNAGRTLVTTATKNNLNLTIVTLNESDEYAVHKTLYEKAFKNYKKYTIIDKNNFKIDKNFYKKDIYIKNSFKYPLKESEINDITTKIELTSTNNPVGKIKIFLNKTPIGEVPIYQKENIKEKEPYLKRLYNKIKNLFIS